MKHSDMSNTILVADDHPVFRYGLVQLIQQYIPEAMIAEAANVNEVRVHLNKQTFDLVLLDLNFPGLQMPEGFQLLRKLADLTAFVVISMTNDPSTVAQVMRSGADGFIGKSVDSKEMALSIQAALDGDIVKVGVSRFDRNNAENANFHTNSIHPALTSMTERQLQVLDGIRRGLSNKQIAQELFISHHTVRIHVSSVLRMLEVHSRASAAAIATSARDVRTHQANTK